MTLTTDELRKLLDDVAPGEWHVGKDADQGTGRGWFVGGGGFCIADMTGPADDTEANARLIALAPTLARRVIAAEKLVEAVWLHLDATIQTEALIDALREYEATK